MFWNRKIDNNEDYSPVEKRARKFANNILYTASILAILLAIGLWVLKWYNNGTL